MNLPLGPLMKLWVISKVHQLATKTLPHGPSWGSFIFKSKQLRNHPWVVEGLPFLECSMAMLNSSISGRRPQRICPCTLLCEHLELAFLLMLF